jgi:anti-anti-sigma regulatory factor
VSFIDSSGLAFILQLHRVAADEDSHVVLRDPPVLLIDMLELIGAGGQIRLEFSRGRADPPRVQHRRPGVQPLAR